MIEKMTFKHLEDLLKSGYTLQYSPPLSYLTDEANEKHAWTVSRWDRPYCDDNGNRHWSAPTIEEAFNLAVESLTKKVQI